MIIDNLYVFIFIRLHRATLENEEITTGDLAKEFFSLDSDEYKKKYAGNKGRFLSAKMNIVKCRLNILKKEGLIEMKDNGKRMFILNNDKVLLKKHKFPCGVKDAILLENKNGLWEIYQI